MTVILSLHQADIHTQDSTRRCDRTLSSRLEGLCHPTGLDHLASEVLEGVDVDNEVEVGRRGLGMRW